MGLVLLLSVSLYVLHELPLAKIWFKNAYALNGSEVYVFLLSGDDRNLSDERFFIDSIGAYYPCFGRIKLSENQAKKLLSAWRNLGASNAPTALCHFPLYGIEFTENNKVKFRTSVSWDCENFFVTSRIFGASYIHFDSANVHSVEMLALLDSLLPYKRGYQKEIETEIQSIIDNTDNP